MDRLFAYFGVVGIASVAAWAAAFVLLVAFARSRRRTMAYVAAVALSMAGFVLAKVNSQSISEIEVDRTAEEAALRAAQASASEGKAAEPQPREPAEEPVYAYRKAGKQKREAGAVTAGTPDNIPASEEPDVPPARRLPEADVLRADRYDRINLFCARLVPWLALALLGYDYLSRFNRTQGYLPPIPIAGRMIDALWPKTRVVHLQVSGPAALRAYLADLVRKGETFIYLGESDPFESEPPLYRWSLWKLRGRPLRKVTVDDPGFPTSEFVLDAAWFGRYCFAVTDSRVLRRLLADLVGYLRARTRSRAAARRTVHVVWHYPAPMPPETLTALAELCRETNFKLAIAAAGSPAKQFESLFEERLVLRA